MHLNEINDVIRFFLVIAGELLVLFVGISFLVSLLQQLISVETIHRVLGRVGKGWGNVIGAFFGALTPFCSCSTIPVLVGLINGGISFGTSMAFLLASPLLNPVILGLFWTVFGAKVTVIYAVFAFVVAVVGSIIWEQLGLAREVKNVKIVGGTSSPEEGVVSCPSSFSGKAKEALHGSIGLFLQMAPYLLLGAGIGALVYGLVPEEWIIRIAGPGNRLAIPLAAVIGVPMYVRTETLIPISGVLMEKGMSLGATMALILGGAGASIPEILLLGAIFRRRLVAVFVITVLLSAMVAGYLFSWLI